MTRVRNNGQDFDFPDDFIGSIGNGLVVGAGQIKQTIRQGGRWVSHLEGTPAPPPVTALFWNPADANGGMLLTNTGGSNKTAVQRQNGAPIGVRSNIPLIGKSYVELIINQRAGTMSIGLALSSASLSGYIGSSTSAFVVLINGGGGGQFFYGSAGQGTAGFYSSVGGDRLCMAIDKATGKLWVRLNNGVWQGDDFNNNPNTALGGASIQISGSTYLAMSTDVYDDSVTICSSNASVLYGIPTGFSTPEA